MVSFGLIEDWNPRPGNAVTWNASPDAVAAARQAPIHEVPPSHQQEEYLRSARRNASAGYRPSRLCLVSFDFQVPLNRDAMSTAVTAFLRRHDTFRSWFSVEADGTIARHMMDVDDIDVTYRDFGHLDTAADIREHAQAHTPGPFEWDCFSFGAIEWDGGFTFYAGVDHLNTDGMSQAMTIVDLMTLYMNATFGLNNPLAPVGSYLDYCERERSVSRQLTRQSPHVERWIELLSEQGGRLPRFPLPLDNAADTHNRSGLRSASVFDEDSMQRFEDVCRANGSNMTAGLMAVAALAYSELTGERRYLGMTPKSTRESGPELNSVGWFTSLIPIPLVVDRDTTFSSAAAQAADSYAEGKDLTDVSLHRVLELVEPNDGIDIAPGWSVPMISYVDVRKLPGVEMFDAINGSLYGSRGSSEEVFLWINRFNDTTQMTFLYPDTEIAAESIKLYTDKLIEIMTAVADKGEYEPVVAALT